MSRITPRLMGLGGLDVVFEERPHLLDKFIPGRCLIFRGPITWTGVITEPGERTDDGIRVLGAGLEWFGGETDKVGAIREPQTYTNLRTDQIVDNLLYRQGLAQRWLNPGTLNVGNVIPSFSIAYESARHAIRRLARMTTTEYRVNPDFTFDWAGNGNLFTTRELVFAVEAGTARTVRYEPTAFHIADKVYALGQGQGDSILVRTAQQALPATWRDWNNNPLTRGLVIDAPNADTEDEAQFVADAQLGSHAVIRQKAKVELRSDVVMSEFEIGDTAYVYKALVLEDPTKEIFYRNRVYPAVQMRVMAADITLGKGWRVFLRDELGNEEDLTEFCGFTTDPKVTLELSADPDAWYDATDVETILTDTRREDQGDRTVPKAPAGLTLTPSVYKDYSGQQRARLTFAWTAVTQNIDNSAITDLARYSVRFRRVTGNAADPWQTVEASSPDVQASVEDLPVGLTWEAQVRAEDTAGNVSTWAPLVPVNSSAGVDTTPPPQPKPGVATGGILMAFVEWERFDASDNPMPADVRWYEIHADTSAAFTPTTATLKGQIDGTAFSFEAAAGSWYVKLIAVDLAGNRSAASGASNAAVVSGGPPVDIPDYSITGQEIAFGAVSSDKTTFGDFNNYADDPSLELSAAGALDSPHNDDQFWSADAAGAASPWEVIKADATNARTGASYLRRLGHATHTGAWFISPNKVPARQGDKVYAEFLFKTSGAPDGTIFLTIRWLDVAGAVVATTDIASSTADPSTYTLLQGTATAPANSVYAQVAGRVTGHTTGTYFVDDVYFRKVIISVWIADAAILTAHIADAQISSAKIALLSVLEGHLANLAVTDAKVASMAVNKLIAGDLTATIRITSGIIQTASSGARVALEADGLNVYSATPGEKVLELDENGLRIAVGTAEVVRDAIRWQRDAVTFMEVRGRRGEAGGSQYRSGAMGVTNIGDAPNSELQVYFAEADGTRTSRLILSQISAILETTLSNDANAARLTLDSDSATLTGDSGSNAAGLVKAFKNPQGSEAYRLTLQGLAKFDSAGFFYPNAFICRASSVKPGSKKYGSVSLPISFPSGTLPVAIGSATTTTGSNATTTRCLVSARAVSNTTVHVSLINEDEKKRNVAGIVVPLLIGGSLKTVP